MGVVRPGHRDARAGGGPSGIHLLGYLLLLLTGFQAGRMACSWGTLEPDQESPASQRAILNRIKRLEQLAEAAARGTPVSSSITRGAAELAARAASASSAAGGSSRAAARVSSHHAGSSSSGAKADPNCVDLEKQCPQWARGGECRKNAGYMGDKCPRSCDKCPEADPDPGPVDPATGCPANRRPFHVIQTADSSTYQQWQSRMMYYHFKKMVKVDPCTEMTGFTRLLNTFDGGCDDLCDEMPTFTVRRMVSGADKAGCDCDWRKVLDSPRCNCDASQANCDCPLDTLSCNFAQCGDLGFVVLNRPYGVLQFLLSPRFNELVKEEYVLIAETDHIYMRPLPNKATAQVPVGYQFGYMNAAEPKLCDAAKPYWADCSVVDPVGPSPVIIAVDQLRKLTPHWFALSMALKRDSAANAAYGWVLEMWGYTLAAARMHIRHKLWPNIQIEPASLWHCDESFTRANYYTFHYTYGLEYSMRGLPSARVGEWSLNKRNYMQHFPPKDLVPPPKCAGACAHKLHALFTEAASNLPNWPAGGKGTTGWVEPLTSPDFDASALAARAFLGTGPWLWRGRKFYFLGEGLLLADVSQGEGVAGSWHAASKGAAGGIIHLDVSLCGEICSITARAPDGPGESPSTFEAECHRRARGTSATSEARLDPPSYPRGAAAWAAALEGASPSLRQQIEGSGPWSWDGSHPMLFLARGLLKTPWGVGEWGFAQGGGAVYANFVGEEHTLAMGECNVFTAVRKRDGAKSEGKMRAVDADPAKCHIDG